MELFKPDADLAVLSIIINHPEMAQNVRLRPYMFNSELHTVIWAAIEEIVGQNNVPETSLLINHLTLNGKLKLAGGIEYISYLQSLQYAPENLDQYIRQVINNYKTRSIIALTSRVSDGLLGGQSVDAAIDEITRTITKFDTESTDDTVSMETALRSAWEQIKEKVSKPGITGITTGYEELDLITGGFNKGDQWIVAGRPSMGKTALMCNMALNCAKKMRETGEYILIYSLEMTKEQLIKRFLSIETGISISDIMFGTLDKSKLDLLIQTIKDLSSLPILINDYASVDARYFVSTTSKWLRAKKVGVVFFDYIQLGTERDEQQTAELGRFSKEAKVFSKKNGITTVFFSQLNRSVESREDKRPNMSDIRQAGTLEEDADIVLMLYRDEYYNPGKSKYPNQLELLIRKNRNGPVGVLPLFTFTSTNLRISGEKNN